MPKPSFWRSLSLLLAGSAGFVLLVGAASDHLPEPLRPHTWPDWPLPLAVLVIASAVGVGQWLWRRRSTAPGSTRERLIAEQRRRWVEGVLETSLHHETPIDLSSRVTVIGEDRPGTEPSRRSVVKVFDEMDGRLLILGAPGAGKTTMLLELLRELLAWAEQGGPVPLLLHLGSWEGRLEDWVNDQAVRWYRANRPLGEWLADGTIVLLLDGLDEVAGDRRAECVDALNAFLTANPGTQMAVCGGQTADGVALRGSMTIEPLTAREVDAHLREANLDRARAVLTADSGMRALITSPLLLEMLVQTDLGALSRSAGDALTRLCGTYTDRMLESRPEFPADRLTPQLRFLARRMSAADRVLFGFDDIDETWVPRPVQVRWRLGALLYTPLLAALGWWWHGAIGAALAGGAGLLFLLPNKERMTTRVRRRFWALQRAREKVRHTEDGNRFTRPFMRLAAGLALTVGSVIGWERGWLPGVLHGAVTFMAVIGADLLAIAEPEDTMRPGNTELPSPETTGHLRRVLWLNPFIAVIIGLVFLGLTWWGSGARAVPFAVTTAFAMFAYCFHSNAQYQLAEQRAVRRALAEDGLLELPATPWLDHARDQGILRKIGPDYMFTHRLLRDHFAKEPPTTPLSANPA